MGVTSLRFTLNFRDVEEMMSQWGVDVSCETTLFGAVQSA
ncbi:hypothetical protein BH10PSE4_BH10PSE4_35550 [soil metagenome]